MHYLGQRPAPVAVTEELVQQPEISNNSRRIAERVMSRLRETSGQDKHEDVLLWRNQRMLEKREIERARDLCERKKECKY